MKKWVEFHRITTFEVERSRCPDALWVFPKPRPYRYYTDIKTRDIVFEKLVEVEQKQPREAAQK